MEPAVLIKPLQKDQIKSYPVLRRRVEETLLLGQQKIEELKVQTYWSTGASINEHVRLNGARAGYGKQVLLKLSRDIKVHESVLRRLAQFAEKIPESLIRAGRRESVSNPRHIEKNDAVKPLTWTHFRSLITIEDDTVRYRLAERAVRQNWSTERLEDEVWKLRAGRTAISSSKKNKRDWLVPRLGRLHTYRLVAPSKIHWPVKNGLMFDHGFKSYKWLAPEEVKGFGEEIVEVKSGRFLKSGRTERDLFTYRAYVDHLIDGDTLWVALDTGLGGVGRQKLRLRGIDAPEINTARGRRAYEFLKATLAPAPYLIVRSSKNDKFDRYETDLFIPAEGASVRDPAVLELADLVFINNLLLERGFAVRMEE